MKKNYITPEINVIQLEALCSGDMNIASVHKADLKMVKSPKTGAYCFDEKMVPNEAVKDFFKA